MDVEEFVVYFNSVGLSCKVLHVHFLQSHLCSALPGNFYLYLAFM